MSQRYCKVSELKPIFHALCLFIAAQLCFAQTPDLKKSFVKESIRGKTSIIKNADPAESGFTELCLFSLRFIQMNHFLLPADEDFILLARETVKKIPASAHPDVLPLLESIFSMTEHTALQKDILENLIGAADSPSFQASVFHTSASIVQLINTYTEQRLASYTKEGSPSASDSGILKTAIEVLGKFKNASSFPVLFSCFLASDTDISNTAERSLDSFAGIYDKQIRAVIASGTIKEKKRALDLVLNNPKNSDFFKAEMSENTLSQTIKKNPGPEETEKERIALKMQAVRELYRVSWTRSPSLMREVFTAARKEYAEGLLTDTQFIEIMYAFTRLASAEAGSLLSNYLKELNKAQEENKDVSTPVVLAVIQSLQLLGDKTAFDDLLYATYQAYPEEVLSAARDALSKLKW
ncbi:hypothetical protein V1L52_09005 [Treponema sp. HNW]|uniref:hypothetical protein n=1 Tax=Treponema sp. HNW TaxID=3116654 RepID=UPI003D09707F